jgi:hypothetical protein
MVAVEDRQIAMRPAATGWLDRVPRNPHGPPAPASVIDESGRRTAQVRLENRKR